jgi:Spx/MgsR family transcriptional regulator
MITIYGLRNCDTCRKALAWLKGEGIAHRFHDVRADGLDRATIARWTGAVDWETLLNRRGTTWRGLAEADKAGLDEAKAVTLMTGHPALIKRPVIEADGAVTVGFDETVRQRLVAG